MTVGARFPSFASPSRALSPRAFPPSPPVPPLLPVTSSSSAHLASLPPPSLVPTITPQIQLGGLGECCKLPQQVRQSPSAKPFRCIFRLKLVHPFHFHNDIFVIFTVPFGCVQVVGATLGHRPHNFLAMGDWGRSPPSPRWSRRLCLGWTKEGVDCIELN